MAESRSWKNEDGNPSISDAFNLQGRDFSISHVHIGCTTHDADNKFRISGADKSEYEKTRRPSIVKAKEITAEIQSNLVRRYENIKLPVASWMEGVDLSMENYTRLELQSRNSEKRNYTIELQNLFETTEGKRPRRILIESQPGFGKTTLTHKIITDWVNYVTENSSGGVVRRFTSWLKNKKYVDQFEFAVIIILRHFKSNSLEEYLAERIVVEDCEAKDVWRLMNNENTLLILDGLDEISDAQKDYIDNILHDPTNIYKMTMAVTCRCGLSRPTVERLNKLHDGVATKKDFWNKKVTISGISENNRDEFLSKFIGECDKDRILHRLHRVIELREQMFTSPLLLILLVYVTRDNSEIDVKTDTALYKGFVDYLVRRSASRNSEILHENFSLFDSSVEHEYKTLFYGFGELALKHVLNNDLHLKHDSLTEKIYKLGFLLKHETVQPLDTVIHYEGFHLSIVEFAVAFFFAEEFKKNKDQFSENLIHEIYEIFVKKGQFSLVISFMCGLLGSEVSYFFDQLSRVGISYWTNPKLNEIILRECDTNNLRSESFSHFVPPFFTVFNESSMSLMQNQCIRQNLKDLHIDSSYLWDVRYPLSLNILKVELTNTPFQPIEIVEQIARHITCKTLLFSLERDLPINVLENYLTLLDSISSACKILNIKDSEIYPKLDKCVTRGTFTGKDLDSVIFELSSFNQARTCAEIIENNRIKSVCFYLNAFVNGIILNIPVSAVIKSKHVKAIAVYSVPVIPVYFDAIVDSEKIWEQLTFENSHFCCKSPINSNTRVKTLITQSVYSFRNSGQELNAVLSVNPLRFHCAYSVLRELSITEGASLWGGWNSVIKLLLILDDLDSIPGLTDFCDVFKFSRVKVICIDVIRPTGKTKFLNIIKHLKSLNLDRLEIRFINMHWIDMYVIRCLQSEIPFFKMFRISVFMDDVMTRDKRRLNIQSLMSILKQNSTSSARLIFKWWDDVRQFVVDNFTDLSRFNLKHFLVTDDFKIDVIMRHIFKLFWLVSWDYNVLEITPRSSL